MIFCLLLNKILSYLLVLNVLCNEDIISPLDPSCSCYISFFFINFILFIIHIMDLQH